MKHLKRIFTCLLMLSLMFTAVACGTPETNTPSTDNNTGAQTPATKDEKIFIRFSKSINGDNSILIWQDGYDYIGIAKAETAPLVNSEYTWLLISDYINTQNTQPAEKQVYVKYSKNSDGADFVDEWKVGYNYMGVAQAESEPTDKADYTWAKFTNYVEPEEAPQLSVYIKYSKTADGADFIDEWKVGYNYMGVAQAESEPTDKTDYSWSKFTEYTEPTTPPSAALNAFYKFSKYADGTDFVDTYDVGYNYIGVSCSTVAPNDKDMYTWTKFTDYTEPSVTPAPEKTVYIRYSMHADGTGYIDNWTVGYNYMGIACLDHYPTGKEDYTWTKFTDYTEPIAKKVYIKYSKFANGNNFVSDWSVGYNYMGVAQAESEPTSVIDYTWTKFTDYTEPEETPQLNVYIKYSKTADGNDFINEWSVGYNYMGVAQAESEPTNKTDYTWTKFTEYSEPEVEPAPELQLYLKYSKYADGSDFIDTWADGYDYMGIAKAESAPADKSGYTWVLCNRVDESKVYFVAYSKYADGSDFVDTWDMDYNYIGIAKAKTRPIDKTEYSWQVFSMQERNEEIFIRYSNSADGSNFVDTWDMGYDYIGVAKGETAPTNKGDYTWTKFYNYVAPTENIYVRYSKYSDGTNYVSNWEKGCNYIGVAKGETAPNDRSEYSWSIINANESQETVFVRYSKYADGSNYADEWEDGYEYIGMAKAVTAPLDKNEYIWTEFKKKTVIENYYIKYSKYADGTEYKSAWENGYDYIGVAKAETEPTNKTDYVWSSISKKEIVENYYIAYSINADGTDYQTEYFDGAFYIGVYHGETIPSNKLGYTWSNFKPLPEEKPKSIKILAIGNSFSDDATEYLWKVYKDAGYETVVIGNLYIGGCSLDTHWANMQGNVAGYAYRKNVADLIKTTENTSILTAFNEEQWDVVTLQQSSGVSGDPSSYRNLQNVINYVKTNEPNAKIFWHMTWAYQQDSTHGDFYRYFNDQRTMYNAIVDTVKSVIVPNTDFAGIIPSGTTIQNLRNSVVGDTLTRDGYHLNFDMGRYSASLTWLRTITNDNIDNITVLAGNEAEQLKINEYLNLIKEAVNKAYDNPFSITACDSLHNLKYLEKTSADSTLLQNYGYDPNNYLKIDLEWTAKGYYNPQDKNFTPYHIFTDAGNSSLFNCTRRFSRTELPVGSLIIMSEGYQYRPEGFNRLSKVEFRPDLVKTGGVVTVTNEWWGSWASRAFNFGVLNTTRDITDADNANLSIFVPIAS